MILPGFEIFAIAKAQSACRLFALLHLAKFAFWQESKEACGLPNEKLYLNRRGRLALKES